MTNVRGRILSRAGVIIGVLAVIGVTKPIVAEEAGDLTLTPSHMVLSSWDSDAPVVRESAPTETEAALAARVAALEQTLQGIQTAALQEPLPAVPGAAQDTCQPLEIVVKPTWKWRGRLYIDMVNYSDDAATKQFFNKDRENEFGFDTARIGVQGDIYENIRYVVELEFEGTETDYKDVFAEAHDMPIGNIRAGHFKEPIGLEELTSSRFITFMKRSYATETFAPARNFGVMAYDSIDACDNASWFLGTFRNDSDDSPDGRATQRSDNGDWTADVRFAFLPYYDEPSEGRYLVHLGGSYSYRNSGELAEWETVGFVGNQDAIGVGALANSRTWNQIGAEFAVVWGAFSVQSEYFQAFFDNGEQYNGAYAELSYFLTGENRGYEKEAKAFYRVHPFEPAFWVDTCNGACCGRGAWELTAGYSYVNLRDGQDIDPGVQERAFVDGFAFGVNWYLNPYSRMMFDYNHEATDFVDAGTPNGDADIFGIRWQIDW
jgi:phosphate-selective porin OprO and OprP